ncbi:hypothetical protein J437_LFUL001255 [Ladona fulva]|uniref:DDE Tnp4 domain-containing protein n=1 Tax=Ladona fulva TaxID=123851 RepID=A0A8K0JUJ6_LADFU|nr:hypothetical protein J437_LFUL001255 [Ladona fulva]
MRMVIIADEAFPLKTYIMRPYSGRDITNDKTIYIYRLSRARRTSENSFALQNEILNIPKKRVLHGTNTELPMVIDADEAFPLKTYIMRPYPGRDITNDKTIYIYRLSRARRTSENSFGILQQKFRIFTRRVQGKPDKITLAVLASCVLHNFIRKNEGYNLPGNIENQSERSEGRHHHLQRQYRDYPAFVEGLQRQRLRCESS